MKKLVCLAVLIAAGGGLVGCESKSAGDLHAYMEEVRARPAGRIEPIPKEVVYEPFTYRATGMRSPFQPPVKLEQARAEQGKVGVQPDETRVREFLEGFNLEAFEMVGTLANEKGVFGLIRGADGVHRVQIGDYMGRNHGRIVGIAAGSIELTELVPDGSGGWLERRRTLVLQERS